MCMCQKVASSEFRDPKPQLCFLPRHQPRRSLQGRRCRPRPQANRCGFRIQGNSWGQGTHCLAQRVTYASTAVRLAAPVCVEGEQVALEVVRQNLATSTLKAVALCSTCFAFVWILPSFGPATPPRQTSFVHVLGRNRPWPYKPLAI